MPIGQGAQVVGLRLQRGLRLLVLLALGLFGGWAALAPALAQTFESVLSPGPVIKGHQKVEHDCKSCHVRFDKSGQDALCLACHKDVGSDMRQHTGWHGRQKPQLCRNCHTDHRGRDAVVVELDRKQFDHRLTDYELRHRHQQVDCAKCHLPTRRWREAPQDCVACHRKDDTHKGGLGTQCVDCHTERKWADVKFDHDAKTHFPLAGKHAQAGCDDCHRGARYKDTPRTCVACHRKDDEQKGHKGRFGDKCDSCHGAQAWKPSTFNHDTDTRYALKGKHHGTACLDCHVGGLQKKLATDCVGCHRKDDDHKGHKGQFGERCDSCHSPRAWKPSSFNHDTDTRYVLRGKHRAITCGDCHTGPLSRKLGKECVDCHRKDDKHKDTLGPDCASCHGERSWKEPPRFDHEQTRFPLLGGHARAECAGCHKDALYRQTPHECKACHQKDDKHKGSLGTQCGDCHLERDWKTVQGRFDHDRARFVLRNAHANPRVKCTDCHRNGQNHREAPRDCIGCHERDDKHEGTLGKRCDSCHNDVQWRQARLDHNRTRYPLLGRHQAVACKDCHVTPRYQGTATDCMSCHRKDDKHKQRFGSACQECHNPRAWSLWGFDHARRGRYTLDGAHAKVACEACHRDTAPQGRLAAPTPNDCLSCHRQRDVHDGAFGARCESCHVSESWKQIRRRGGAGVGAATVRGGEGRASPGGGSA